MSENTAFCTLNWEVLAEVMKMANAPPELYERWGTGEHRGKLVFNDMDGTTLEVAVTGVVERITGGTMTGYRFELVSDGEAKSVQAINAMRF